MIFSSSHHPKTSTLTKRTELVKRTATSEQQKIQQLISGKELSDRKPTLLLHCMQQLLEEKLSSSPDANAFVQELFLQWLPANVQMVLAFPQPVYSDY